MLKKRKNLFFNAYTLWFLVPALIIYLVIFILPTFMSFFFSLTIWNLTDYTFVGFDNFKMIFEEPELYGSFTNTIIYSVLSTVLKVVIAVMLAVLLTSKIRSKNILRSIVLFPYMVSTLAIGLAFSAIMHPTRGVLNSIINSIGIPSIDWLINPKLALYSIIFVDVWKGMGVASVICIAGIESVPKEYYEAVAIDGGKGWHKFKNITLPLIQPAINSVIILAFVGGMRSFGLIWSMTQGGPGFATDVLASMMYKQYAYGFYGLATAGNVLMFLLIAFIAFPLYKFLIRREVNF